jgi:hypothetical protein
VTFDGRNWRPHLTAECRGIALTDAEKFPYTLRETTGQVEYRPAHAASPDQLRLDLTGVASGRPVRVVAELRHVAPSEPAGVTINTGVASNDLTHAVSSHTSAYRGASRGRNALSSRRHPIGWVEVSGNDIPLHEQLFVALPKKGESLVRSLQAQGSVDFRFRCEWETVSQPRAKVTQEIRLKDCAVQFGPFPYPLRHIDGVLTADDLHWKLNDVTARGPSDFTTVSCGGEVFPQGDTWHANLLIQVLNVPLDEHLRLALSPAGQRAWQELRPQGRIDFTAHVVQNHSQAPPAIEVTLASRDQSVSVEMARFPYRLEQVEGVAVYKAGRVELQNVHARHGRALYSVASSAWESTPDGGWQVMLNGFNADRLTPDRELIVALPPRLRQALQKIQPEGSFGVYNSALSFAKARNSEQVAAAWDIHLDCHQASIQCATPIRGISGEVRLAGRDDRLGSYTTGDLALDSLVVKDMQLTNVRGPLWVDTSYCLLGEAATQKLGQPPRRITADAYGGGLTANVDIQHAVNPAYKVDMAIGGANLARFANERLGGPEDMSGTVSGRLLLAGAGQSKESLRGSGELHVVDANIYKLPVLVAMLKVLRNRPPDTTAFNRCDMQFTIHGQDIHFQQLNLLGDAVSFYGKGDADFNRRIDLVFYTLLEPAIPIPILKTIAGQLSQQAWQLQVVGTWDNVQVQHQTLPGVNQMWEQIQAEFQGGPVPATANRRAPVAPK